MTPRKEGPELREKIKKILHKALDKLIEAIWNVVEEEVIAEDGGSVEAEKAMLPVEDAGKGTDWTVGVEDGGRVEEEDEEMVEIKEIGLFICKITRDFKPEKLTEIVMNRMESYEQLASRIHLAWSDRSHEELHEVVPDISECWPEGYLDFFTLDGKKLETSLPWSQFEKELHHIEVGVFE
ncbi:hypothetical protein RHSIM_Rhsim08G0220100 [Rhododendron simsii]|uniref:Uncharacterized protein n=1 Tax=Rhododendron simsii TaxID=118357 RepID=A0A834LHG3_RHOSS|nr:hypothetical protein RHSIM_Rhsim08G0220100 [Rhododendron simsii]